MNVRCPQCETLFRVDPSKVPERGVRARCASCASVMTVRRPRRGEEEVRAPTGSVAQAAAVPRERPAHAAHAVEPRTVTAPPMPEPGILVPRPRPRPEPAVSEPVIPEPILPARELKVVAEERVEIPVESDAGEAEPVIPDMELPFQPPPPELTPRRPEKPAARVPRYSRPFIQPRATSDASVKAPPAAPPRPTAPVFRPTPGTPVQAPVRTGSPIGATPAERRVPSPAAPVRTGAVEKRKPINPFLSRDPSQKARRLARALVSDMIVYQPKKRQEALQSGTLKEAFGEEIKKSWEEYVQQVGEDTARSTDFFREALNDILAGGRMVFEAGFKF